MSALRLHSQLGSSDPIRVRSSCCPPLSLCPPGIQPLSQISPEDFNGNCCDPAADPLDCTCNTPDLELVRKIVAQVEFYLSDENLARDTFLLKHVQKNKQGFVSIKLLTSFKKVKYLSQDWRLTLYALRFSELLEVNVEGTKVRRKSPLPDLLLGSPPSKLLLAWEPRGLELAPASPPSPALQQAFLEAISGLFSPFGLIASIRILQPGKKLPPSVQRYVLAQPELLSSCCALVEYESLEAAAGAFSELSRRLAPGASAGIRVVRLFARGPRKQGGEQEDGEEGARGGQRAPPRKRGPRPQQGEPPPSSSSESDGTPVSPPDSLLGLPRGHGGLRAGYFSLPCIGPPPPRPSLLPPAATTHARIQKGAGPSWGHGPSSRPQEAAPAAALGVGKGTALPIHRLPRGPDGTKGFHSSIGRGGLVLRQ
ncbi:la-related protein 6-like [Tachyglossus aculeatus]|uniref:la-related protein 6-like n=1 Tax=Tachyglossus aculeatus TaxID=9261 RepID=UPI0018F2F1A3|nr:la-related protein 6-like [Tachyglossus aculeatus]